MIGFLLARKRCLETNGEGSLVSERIVVEGKTRKYYSLTPGGEEALEKGRVKAIELLNEIREEE